MQRTGQWFIHLGVWLVIGLLVYLFFLRQSEPRQRVLGDSAIELERMRDGHFHIEGDIAGERDSQSVRFLIDTGASAVSIPQALARDIGLKCERAATFNTANGLVQGCTARASRLSFGPFSLEDVSVMVLPNLGDQALLGMNVLSRLRIEQSGDRLRLSAAQTHP